MKPNLEISLKFWYIMIAIFAVVLSIPFCDYLYANHEVKHIYVTGILISCLFFLAFNIDLLLRLTELKSKLNKETFFNKVSAQTIEDYEHQIKLQAAEITERKKYFEDAIVEIGKLSNNIISLKEVNNMILNKNINQKEQITYWKERALHQKHTKKVVESDMWECITKDYESFKKGEKYKLDISIKSQDDLLWLFVNEDHLHPYLVYKKDFKPVKS